MTLGRMGSNKGLLAGSSRLEQSASMAPSIKLFALLVFLVPICHSEPLPSIPDPFKSSEGGNEALSLFQTITFLCIAVILFSKL